MLHVGVLPHHGACGATSSPTSRFVVVDEAHVYRGVFGSHVANVLRRLRRIAADLRRRAAFSPRVGDDREPGELAVALTGLRSDRGRGRRRAARRADDRAVEPAAARCRAGDPRSSRSARRRGCSPGSRQRGLRTICFAKSRKAAELIHRFAADRLDAATAERARAVPRRLHAAAAPRDRAAPRRGRAPRRDVDRRARARDRHRRPRRGDLGRLPRHGREPAPAVGTRRAALARPRGARRLRGRARPVLHARARRRCSTATSRRRSSTTRTRACSTATSPCAAVRGADRRERRGDARARGARARAARRRSCSRRRAAAVWAGKDDYPAARTSRSARRRPTRSSSSTPRPARCSASSSASARTRPSTRARSTSTSAASTSCASSTWAPMRAVVEPFDGDWYTQAKKRDRRPRSRRSPSVETSRGARLSFGGVAVTEHGRRVRERRRSPTTRRSTSIALELPPTRFDTQAVWFELDGRTELEGLEAMPLGLLLGRCTPPSTRRSRVLPLSAMCDRWDIGGLSTNIHLADRRADGLRLRRPRRRSRDRRSAASTSSRAVSRTQRSCSPGAPASAAARRACSSPKCGNLNEPLSKQGALVLLALLGAQADSPRAIRSRSIVRS